MNPLADIIERVEMVAPPDPWWWARLLGALVLVAAVAGGVGWRLYRQGRLPFLQSAPVPPERSALDELAAIRHLIDAGLVREFTREASRVLRGYIEARFGLRAPRLSTEEFLYEAERNEELDPGRRERLGEFLFGCDKVKFALDHLDTPRMESLYAAAVNFVNQTTPAPAPAKP